MCNEIQINARWIFYNQVCIRIKVDGERIDESEQVIKKAGDQS